MERNGMCVCGRGMARKGAEVKLIKVLKAECGRRCVPVEGQPVTHSIDFLAAQFIDGVTPQTRPVGADRRASQGDRNRKFLATDTVI